jgi:hypothetical protein
MTPVSPFAFNPGSQFDPDVVRKQGIAVLIKMAEQTNELRQQQYDGQCAQWITVNVRNRELGLPLTPLPIVPKLITVDTTGEWWETPQALPAPVLPPETPPQTGGSLRPPIGAVPPDRVDKIIAFCNYQAGVMEILNDKLDKVLAKLETILERPHIGA